MYIKYIKYKKNFFKAMLEDDAPQQLNMFVPVLPPPNSSEQKQDSL